MTLQEQERFLESELFKLAEQKKTIIERESSLLIELYKVRGKLEFMELQKSHDTKLCTPDEVIPNPAKSEESFMEPVFIPTKPGDSFKIASDNNIQGATFVI